MITTAPASKPSGIRGACGTRWLRRPSITRDAAVTNPRDAHAVVDLLRERAAAGNCNDRLRRLSIHSTDPHPTPSVHLWAGQHIQPHAHHQVEPTLDLWRTPPLTSPRRRCTRWRSSQQSQHFVHCDPRGRWAERSWSNANTVVNLHLPSTAFLHSWKARKR